jgi:hypothetical protein
MAEEYFFPQDRQYYEGSTRVRFSAFEHQNTDFLGFVDLYCPRNLSFGDNANYNNFDLGALTSMADNLYDKATRGGLSVSDMGSAMKDMISSGVDPMGKGKDMYLDAMLLTSDKLGLNRIKDLLSYKSKRAVNPNTHTLYSGVSIRKFNFSFSLIAKDQNESKAIKGMVDLFRKYTYGELADHGMTAKFPPFWRIQFYHGDGGSSAWKSAQENQFIPIIHDCFLESFASAHNTEANSWHKDGAPFDVSISLGFTETKTYDQKTILQRDSKDT